MSNTEYTPTTEQVRAAYVDTGWAADGSLGFPRDVNEFDRWLADHDAQVRADERERIAAAIEDVSRRLGDEAWGLSRDPHGLQGAQEMFAAKCYSDAARIARAEPTDSEVER